MTAWTCTECASENDGGAGGQCVVCGARCAHLTARTERVVRRSTPGRVDMPATVGFTPPAPAQTSSPGSARVPPPRGHTDDAPVSTVDATDGYTGEGYRYPGVSDDESPDSGGPAVFVSSAYRRRAPFPWAVVAAALLVTAAVGGLLAVRYHLLGGGPQPVAATTAPATTAAQDPAPGDLGLDQPAPADPTPADPTPADPTPPAAAAGPVAMAAAAAADPAGEPVQTMLDTYFTGINNHDVAAALSVYDPSGVVDPTDPGQVEQFARGISTTTNSDITLLAVWPDTSGAAAERAEVTFVSTQQPGYGPEGSPDQTCTGWDVTYLLTLAADGRYLIKGSSARHQAC